MNICVHTHSLPVVVAVVLGLCMSYYCEIISGDCIVTWAWTQQVLPVSVPVCSSMTSFTIMLSISETHSGFTSCPLHITTYVCTHTDIYLPSHIFTCSFIPEISLIRHKSWGVYALASIHFVWMCEIRNFPKSSFSWGEGIGHFSNNAFYLNSIL